MPDRSIRTCIACGRADDHPKHGVTVDGVSTAHHHYDCGPAMDPPCGHPDPDIQRVCEVAAGPEAPGTGEAMRAHLVETLKEL